MRLSSEDFGNVVVITLAEPKLDAMIAREFRDLASGMAREDRSFYLLDLSAVTFMDSSGIGSLVGVMKLMGRSKRLELCGMTPAVRKVFKLTRMDKIFNIHDTREDGLQAHAVTRQSAAG